MRTCIKFKVTGSPVRLVSKSRRHPAAPAPVSSLRRLDRYITASAPASIVHALRAMPPAATVRGNPISRGPSGSSARNLIKNYQHRCQRRFIFTYSHLIHFPFGPVTRRFYLYYIL